MLWLAGKWRRLELGTADGGHSLLSLPGEPVSLRISLEGRLSESHLGLVFLRLKPFLISARRWSMMQPSFCWTIPFLTGERQRQRDREKKGRKISFNQERAGNLSCVGRVTECRDFRRTYFAILPFLPLGFFFCELLLSLLSLGRLLSPGFVFLKAPKSGCHSHMPGTQSTLQSARLIFQAEFPNIFRSREKKSTFFVSPPAGTRLLYCIMPNITPDL